MLVELEFYANPSKFTLPLRLLAVLTMIASKCGKTKAFTSIQNMLSGSILDLESFHHKYAIWLNVYCLSTSKFETNGRRLLNAICTIIFKQISTRSIFKASICTVWSLYQCRLADKVVACAVKLFHRNNVALWTARVPMIILTTS